jgi:hypothetical protein
MHKNLTKTGPKLKLKSGFKTSGYKNSHIYLSGYQL